MTYYSPASVGYGAPGSVPTYSIQAQPHAYGAPGGAARPIPNSNPPAGTAANNGELTNVNAAQLAAQVANWAAQLEFQKTRFQLMELPQFQSQDATQRQQLQIQMDQLAFQKAQAAYQNALQEAALTGTYQGKPTTQWLTEQAQLTGVMNGQETLQGKLNDAQIAQMQHAMALESQNFQLQYQKYGTDTEHWDKTFASQQASDLRNYTLAEAGLTGKFNGQDTLAAQSQSEVVREARAREAQQAADSQQTGALGYLNLLATVQNNPFKMLKVQQNAGNFNNLAAGWLGKVQMPGSGTITGNPGGPAGPGDLLTQYNPDGSVVPMPALPTYKPADSAVNPALAPTAAVPVSGAMGAQALDPITGYAYSPPGSQAPVGDYNYMPTASGQTQIYPPGVVAPANGAQLSTTTPQTPGSVQGMVGAVGAEGSNTPGSTDVLTPNKINARNYNNSNAGQQKLLWQYEDSQGWDPETAQSIYKQSLPTYAGPATGKVVRAA